MRQAIWLVEPSRLFREGLNRILSDSRFEVTVAVSSLDGLTALDTLDHRPALILISLQKGPEPVTAMHGDLAATCARWRGTPVVVLAEELSLDQLVSAFRAGASGYLVKEVMPEVLRESLVLATLGESVFPSELVTAVLRDPITSRTPASTAPLTSQEKNILGYLARGERNKRIAAELSLPEGTVKSSTKSLFHKLGVSNRTEAAIWALSNVDTSNVPEPHNRKEGTKLTRR